MADRKTLDDWAPLPAERRLAEGMASGLTVQIGDGTLPAEDAPEDRVIRTSFLRALILGRIEDHPPHDKGVRVAGAYLRGDGPKGAATPGLDLFACRRPDLLRLQGASLRNLFLSGSHLGAGLEADGLQATGDVVLHGCGDDPKSPDFRPFVAMGAVRLHGAKPGGDVDCDGARLTAAGKAPHADGLKATLLAVAGFSGLIRTDNTR